MESYLLNRVFSIAIIAFTFVVGAPVFAAQGKTDGQFGVSPWGTAQYTIPIWAPPGPRGIQPAISLSYDSTGGIGPLGIGWSLGGIGAVTRCNKTVAQDLTAAPVALINSDGYCLNGNRLRLTSGTGTYGADGSTYQTELADFTLITLHQSAGTVSGPAYFTVQGRDGLTYQYGYVDSNGNGTNAQVIAPGSSPSTATIWYLSKVTDRSGNNYVINYNALTGDAVPNTIQWTPVSEGASTYTYTMHFIYSPNVPKSSPYRFVAGTVSNNDQLLTSITIANGSTVFKDYILQYDASASTGREELETITECADTGRTNCLIPTTVGYSAVAAGVSPTITNVAGVSNLITSKYDFNGDGIPDIIYASGGNLYIAWGSSNGYSAGVPTGVPQAGALFGDLTNAGADGILSNNGGTWFYYMWNASTSSFTGTSTGIQYQTMSGGYELADINGDGLPDLVSANAVVTSHTGPQVIGAGSTPITTYTTAVYVYSRLNTTTGTTASISGTQNTAVSFLRTGVANIFLVGPDQQFGKLRRYDFNGDKLDDLVLEIELLGTNPTLTTYELLSNGASFTTVQISSQSASNFIPVYFTNWNDDACTDMAITGTLYISGCNGTIPASFAVGTVVGALDWDDDRRTDLLVVNGSNLGVYVSNGTSATPMLQPTNIPYSSANHYYALDVYGHGIDDLGVVSISAGTLSYYQHNGTSDLAISFADGYGVTYSPTYVPLAASGGVYSPGLVAPLPPRSFEYRISLQDPTEPSQIVASYTASDGIGGLYTVSYKYAEAVVETLGRGFQGFAQVKTTDSRNSVSETQDYAIVFPASGMIVSDTKTQSSNEPISVFTAHSMTVIQDTTPNNERYFPYNDTETTSFYEVGGIEDGTLTKTQVVTRSAPDVYGNFSNVETTLTDVDPSSPFYNNDTNNVWTSTTATTIVANPSTWCNSLASEIDVTNTAPNTGAITRHTGFTPDYTNCRESASVAEQGSTYQVNIGYSYDSFGNVNAQTVLGAGMTARTASVLWATTGQFPVNTTNAIAAAGTAGAQTTQLLFDANFGVLSSLKDPNGIITTWKPDAFGRPYQEIRPDQTVLQRTYSVCSGCDPLAKVNVTTQVLDTAGNPITQSSDYLDMFNREIYHSDTLLDGTIAWTGNRSFDSLGRIVAQQIPFRDGSATPGSQTTMYDILDRPYQFQRPISSTNSSLQTTKILFQGRMTKVTDAMNNTATTYTQVDGNIGRTQDANGYYINFGHDALGNLTTAKDNFTNLLRSIGYGYGIKAFPTSMTDMDLGARSWTPNALGEVVAWSDAKNQHFSAMYDALSRMVSRTEPDLTTTWTWGTAATKFEIGKLASVTSGTGTNIYKETYAYDTKGRISDRTFTLPSDSVTTRSFDYIYNTTTGLLDTLQYPAGYPSGFRVQAQYAYQHGILVQIHNATSPATIFWQATGTNPRGQITNENTGNASGNPREITTWTFDAVTGWLNSVTSGSNGGTARQNEAYMYDKMGNLVLRQDLNINRGLTENIYYDKLYRLDHSTLSTPTVPTPTVNLQMCYDNTSGGCTANLPGMGNITSRSDVAGGAAWTYDPVKKHAVTQAGSAATYNYDANGNAATRNGSLISWTTYNYPSGLSSGSETATFDYGPDRQRWRMIYNNGGSSESTLYATPMFEAVTTSLGTEYRYYIYAANRPVVLISRSTTGSVYVRSLLTNHQGSLSDIVDNSSGALVASESFTPYGLRREASSWSGAPTSSELLTMNGVTRQGYTFQTVLGSMGLNHMNGRVEDAVIGRFLSADPVTSEPNYTQGWNRYTYVDNNPVTDIDPSGFDCTVTAAQISPGGSITTEYDGEPKTTYFPPKYSYTFSPGCYDRRNPVQGGGGGQGTTGGHDYHENNLVCKRPLSDAEAKDLLSRFTVPNVYTQGQPQDPGLHVVASPYSLALPAGVVTTSFSLDGLVGTNRTTFLHPFTGIVNRQVTNVNGMAYIDTHGTGGYGDPDASSQSPYLIDYGALMDAINQITGPEVFDSVDAQAARYAASHYPGCSG